MIRLRLWIVKRVNFVHIGVFCLRLGHILHLWVTLCIKESIYTKDIVYFTAVTVNLPTG